MNSDKIENEKLLAKIARLEASKLKLVRSRGCARDEADKLLNLESALRQNCILLEEQNTRLENQRDNAIAEANRLKTIQQDMAWEITTLSELLTREQRIVDFLTGQQQD